MPLDPKKTFYNRVVHIQRDVFANLPPLNQSGSPTLGTRCRLDNGEYYCVVADDTLPNNQLKWELETAAVGGGDPDQRFTVAPAGYALDTPGTNTFLTPQEGVLAASLGTGTTLGAAGVNSQRMVWIMPARYVGADLLIPLTPYVHLQGGGGGAGAVELVSYFFSYGGTGNIVISDIKFTNCTFDLSAADNTSIVFKNCQYENCSVLPTASGQNGFALRFLDCSGNFNNFDIGGDGSFYLEFSGSSSTSAPIVSGANVSRADTVIRFTNQINIIGTLTCEMVIKSGQQITYDDAYLILVDGGSLLTMMTSEMSIYVPVVSANLMRITGASGIDWIAYAGTNVIGTPETIFNADPGSTGIIEVSNFSLPLTNGTTPVRPCDPVSGGTVDAVGLGDGRCLKMISLTVNVEVGGSVASQTATLIDGSADVIWVTANYQAGTPLQPDTANAAGRNFASLLLIDPSDMFEGKEIIIYNNGNPAANQSAFAIRLPSGTASRIGYQQPDISVNPVYTDDEYIILYPGDSVQLTVNQSFSPPTSYIVTSIQRRSVQPGWLAEAMAQYDALPAPIAGNNTTGMLFFARQDTKSGAANVYCQGGRFYWGSALPNTIRVSLWRTGSAVAVATVDVAVNGIGVYEGRFTTPALINGFENWFITFYETTGTLYQDGAPIPNFASRYSPGIQMRSFPLYTGIQSGSQAGDNKPAIFPGPSIYYLIEPIVSTNVV